MSKQPPRANAGKVPGRYELRKKNPWIAFINLGALLAGVTVGYFFRKMEEEFTRYGEGLMMKIMRGFKGDKPSEDRTSHHHRRFEVEDPLAEGYDFDDDRM